MMCRSNDRNRAGRGITGSADCPLAFTQSGTARQGSARACAVSSMRAPDNLSRLAPVIDIVFRRPFFDCKKPCSSAHDIWTNRARALRATTTDEDAAGANKAAEPQAGGAGCAGGARAAQWHVGITAAARTLLPARPGASLGAMIGRLRRPKGAPTAAVLRRRGAGGAMDQPHAAGLWAPPLA